jgi:tetratricopeptide (TPR) repeat protein
MWSALIPKAVLAWQERRRIIAEMQSMAEEETAFLGLDDTNPVYQAKVAISLNDNVSALRHWREAVRRYPVFAQTSHDSLDVLIGLKLFDEAERLMLDGRLRAPRDRFYAGGYARVAEERKDLPEALERWKGVIKEFPGWWMGYVHMSACLRMAGKPEEAETKANFAAQRFPDEFLVILEWGRCAEARKDWVEAIRRWERFVEQFKNAHGDLGVAHALEGLGRLDEAEKRLEVARLRAPLSTEILIDLARLAYLRGDPEESARRWTQTRQRLPLLPFGYQGEIRLLREMRRYAEAEAVAFEAMDRFPAEQWPIVEYAQLATDRQDWEQAVERWGAVRSAWPARGDAFARAADALFHLGRNDDASRLQVEMAARGLAG